MSSLLSSWSGSLAESTDLTDMMSLLDGSFIQKQLDEMYLKFQVDRFRFLDWIRESGRFASELPLIRRHDWQTELLAWEDDIEEDDLYTAWMEQAKRMRK